MGSLVHRSFPDELANGVLITKNIYRSEYAGITVNVQKGENSVVKPEEGVSCDEFYAHSFNIPNYKMSNMRKIFVLFFMVKVLDDTQSA